MKHNHLYLTPVKTCFTLRENLKDKLLHTYVHINTLPTVKELIEVEDKDGSLPADAIAENSAFLRLMPSAVP